MSAMQTSLWCSVLCVSKHKGKWQMVVVMHTHTHKECTHMTTATTTVDSTTLRAQTSFLKDSILFIYGAHTRNNLNINICWLVRCEMPYDKNALVFVYIHIFYFEIRIQYRVHWMREDKIIKIAANHWQAIQIFVSYATTTSAPQSKFKHSNYFFFQTSILKWKKIPLYLRECMRIASVSYKFTCLHHSFKMKMYFIICIIRSVCVCVPLAIC